MVLHRYWTTFLLLILAAGALPVIALASDSNPNDAPTPIDLPADDRVHDDLIEWWYFTGHLEDDSGARYGFEFVFFRASTGRLQAYVSHAAITDHTDGTFSWNQKSARGEASINSPGGQLALRLDDWSMSLRNGVATLEASVDDYEFTLRIMPTKPPVLHAHDGYIQYDDDSWSYYYSRTRNEVSGTFTKNDLSRSVTGTAWFDHQWGAINTFRDGGWDWFSIQLDNDTEIMAYVLYHGDRSVEQVDVTIVAADGTVSWLGAGDIQIVATSQWTSPRTGITWPSGWELAIPSQQIAITLTPVLADQELDTTTTTGVIYWEGEVAVEGAMANAPVSGAGYVELTGYDATRSET